MFNSGVIQYLADTSSLFTEEGTFDEAVADLNTFAEMLGGLNNIQPKEIIDSLNGNTEENKDSSVEENQTSSGDISFYFFDRGVDKNSAENFANFLKTAGYTDNEISETFDGMDIWWDKNDKFKDQFGADFQFKYVDGEVVA